MTGKKTDGSQPSAPEAAGGLTENPKRDTLHRRVQGASKPPRASRRQRESPKGSLDDTAWLDLVERLLALTPPDFSSLVLAVRLHRRLEKGLPDL